MSLYFLFANKLIGPGMQGPCLDPVVKVLATASSSLPGTDSAWSCAKHGFLPHYPGGNDEGTAPVLKGPLQK